MTGRRKGEEKVKMVGKEHSRSNEQEGCCLVWVPFPYGRQFECTLSGGFLHGGSGPCRCPEMWNTRREMTKMESPTSFQNVSNLQNLMAIFSAPLEFINLFNKCLLDPICARSIWFALALPVPPASGLAALGGARGRGKLAEMEGTRVSCFSSIALSWGTLAGGGVHSWLS